MIVVISFPGDPHAERVLGHLREAGEDALLLDLSAIPDRTRLTIDYGANGHAHLELDRDGEAPVDLDRARSIWWRRPQAVAPTTVTDPDLRLFVGNEWHEALNGLWQLLRDRLWINDLVRDDVASRKALQLRTAREVGLAVPRTLITSDPDRARAFISSVGVGKAIFKTFSCTHQVWRETRLVRDEDLGVLDTVRLAPVIFQEYVPADADLRVTVVGPHVFPAAIRSAETDYPVDFRMSLGQARTAAAELPEAVLAGLRSLMDRLGLVYGAIDMRRTPAGEHVFLEVNTAGEFLFVEERTGLPIARTLAEVLAAPAAGSAARQTLRTVTSQPAAGALGIG